jgi:hypothetical protein
MECVTKCAAISFWLIFLVGLVGMFNIILSENTDSKLAGYVWVMDVDDCTTKSAQECSSFTSCYEAIKEMYRSMASGLDVKEFPKGAITVYGTNIYPQDHIVLSADNTAKMCRERRNGSKTYRYISHPWGVSDIFRTPRMVLVSELNTYLCIVGETYKCMWPQECLTYLCDIFSGHYGYVKVVPL